MQNREWNKKAEKSYFQTPVVLPEALDAVIHLLTVFAQHLSDDITRHLMSIPPETEVSVVRNAKSYVAVHAQDPLTLDQVLQHVQVSRFHFCKVFKKTTGMTFTEYVARVRVEKAKAMLLNPSFRVSEVVFAAGFGSIPQFNSVFKRIVGMSPTAYRIKLRSPASISESPVLKFPTCPPTDVKKLRKIIRTTAFQPEANPTPSNIIRPALRHPSHRIARG